MIKEVVRKGDAKEKQISGNKRENPNRKHYTIE